MAESDCAEQEGCAIQMDTFAEMLRLTTKELEKSMFTDERMEKKLIGALKRKGVRVLDVNFFMNKEGKYEVHVTARAMKEQCVTLKELAGEVSVVLGRRLVPDGNQMQTLGREYITVIVWRDRHFIHSKGWLG